MHAATAGCSRRSRLVVEAVVGKCLTSCSMAFWMKKMPVDSSGSTNPLDSPMATQLLTQEFSLRPIRILMWLASQVVAAGPTYSRSVALGLVRAC